MRDYFKVNFWQKINKKLFQAQTYQKPVVGLLFFFAGTAPDNSH